MLGRTHAMRMSLSLRAFLLQNELQEIAQFLEEKNERMKWMRNFVL